MASQPDNTDGRHVAISRLTGGRSEASRFEDMFLAYDEALGPLRQSVAIEASGIAFHWWPGDHVGLIGHAAGPRIILLMEGAAEVEADDGERRIFHPGGVLEHQPSGPADHVVRSSDGKPFRAAIIALGPQSLARAAPMVRESTDHALPYVRNVTGEDNRSHFQDGTLPYYTDADGGLVTESVSITRFQYVYAASDLRYDFHNAPQRQIVLPLTGGTQGENGDGSRRVIPAGGVYFGEDTTGEGHITSAVNNAIRFSIFAHLA